MVGDAQELPSAKDNMHKLRLIDFGFCKKYINTNGQHVNQQKEDSFRGNIHFASKNALNMITLGRRDDLIQLCYLLLYLIDGNLVFIHDDP